MNVCIQIPFLAANPLLQGAGFTSVQPAPEQSLDLKMILKASKITVVLTTLVTLIVTAFISLIYFDSGKTGETDEGVVIFTMVLILPLSIFGLLSSSIIAYISKAQRSYFDGLIPLNLVFLLMGLYFLYELREIF